MRVEENVEITEQIFEKIEENKISRVRSCEFLYVKKSHSATTSRNRNTKSESESTPCVTVSVKSVRVTTQQSQTQTDDDNLHDDCQHNETKLAKEISDLKRALSDKTEIISQLQHQHAQIDSLKSNEITIWRQRVENANQTVEAHKQEILNLKNKIRTSL